MKIPYLLFCLTPGLILLPKSTLSFTLFHVWVVMSTQISIQILFQFRGHPLIWLSNDRHFMSPASIVLIYAARKCLHYFKLDDGPNLLNNACCRNMTEYGKRTRSLPVSKKKPVDVDIVKSTRHEKSPLPRFKYVVKGFVKATFARIWWLLTRIKDHLWKRLCHPDQRRQRPFLLTCERL